MIMLSYRFEDRHQIHVDAEKHCGPSHISVWPHLPEDHHVKQQSKQRYAYDHNNDDVDESVLTKVSGDVDNKDDHIGKLEYDTDFVVTMTGLYSQVGVWVL